MNHLQGFSLWIRTCWTNHALLGALAGKLHYPHQHSCRVVPLPVGSSDEESKWNSRTDFTGITNFVHVPWSSWCFFSLSSLPFPFFCSRHGFYEKVARNWSQKESSWTSSSILVSDQPLLSSRLPPPPRSCQRYPPSSFFLLGFSVALLGVAAGASSSSPPPGGGSTGSAREAMLPPSPASRSSPGQWPRVWNPQHPTAHATHCPRILGYCSLDNNSLPVVPVFTDRWQAIHLSQKLAGRIVMPSPS